MAARIFIGSSAEDLPVARSLQELLDKEYESTIWEQALFDLSATALETLVNKVSSFDAAIFILGPHLLVRSRGNQYQIANQNVVFELGLFFATLGSSGVYMVVPRPGGAIVLPSDLAGITWADYEAERIDGNLQAALGPAANKIRRSVEKHLHGKAQPRPRRTLVSLFSGFDSFVRKALSHSTRVQLGFVHSRRWRETLSNELLALLDRRATSLEVMLPDLRSMALMAFLRERFDDGEHIPNMLADAYRYFGGLHSNYSKKIVVRLYRVPLSYSFYGFDREALLALYPNSSVRKPVPTMLVEKGDDSWDFFQRDLADLRRELTEISGTTLMRLSRSKGGK